jgi:hypothetical protein
MIKTSACGTGNGDVESLRVVHDPIDDAVPVKKNNICLVLCRQSALEFGFATALSKILAISSEL